MRLKCICRSEDCTQDVFAVRKSDPKQMFCAWHVPGSWGRSEFVAVDELVGYRDDLIIQLTNLNEIIDG